MICHGCGGVVGRDCFNMQECEQITRDMAMQYQRECEQALQSPAVELIAQERQRQVTQEGWTVEHDDRHKSGELGDAAACYAMSERHRGRVIWDTSIRRLIWPWNASWWKPTPDDRIRELVKAGALIVAEIERLQRIKK